MIVPARLGAGGMARETARGTPGRRGNPGVGQARAGSDPRGAPRHRPGMVPRTLPSFSSRRLPTSRSCDSPLAVSGEVRARRARNPRNPHRRRGRFQPSPASSWAGPQVAQGQPRGGSARGHFLPRRAECRPVSRPRPEARPAPVRRPGRWRLRATDAGAAPVPGPDRSATGQAPEGPEGRPGIAPKTPRTGAVRKHRIGTLSRSERSWTSRRAGGERGSPLPCGRGTG